MGSVCVCVCGGGGGVVGMARGGDKEQIALY